MDSLSEHNHPQISTLTLSQNFAAEQGNCDVVKWESLRNSGLKAGFHEA
jgi:hypothetical protein